METELPLSRNQLKLLSARHSKFIASARMVKVCDFCFMYVCVCVCVYVCMYVGYDSTMHVELTKIGCGMTMIQ